MNTISKAVTWATVTTISLGAFATSSTSVWAGEEEPHIVVEFGELTYITNVHGDNGFFGTPEAEAKAIILTEKTCKGRPASMKLPTNGYVSLEAEQSTTVFSGQSMGVCINDDTEEVYFKLMIVDEDTLSPEDDYILNKALGGMATVFSWGILKRRNPAAITAVSQSIVVAEQLVADYFARADVMGETTIKLMRSEGWQADGKPHTIISTNGAVKFTYVIRVATPLKSPAPMAAPVPSAASKTLVVKQDVFLRNGPGREYDNLTTLHSGDEVEVIEDSGGWIRVRYNGQEGWVGGRKFFR